MSDDSSDVTDAFIKLIEKLAAKEQYLSNCVQCGKGFKRIGPGLRRAFCADCTEDSSTTQLLKAKRDAIQSEVKSLKSRLERAETELASYEEELVSLGWQKDARAVVKINREQNCIELKIYQNGLCIEDSVAKIYNHFHVTRVFESDLQGKVIRVPWKQLKAGLTWEQEGLLSDQYLFIKKRDEGFEPTRLLRLDAFRSGRTNPV